MNPYLRFGLAGESAAYGALLATGFGCGLLLWARQRSKWHGDRPSRIWIWLLLLAASSTLLSWAYLQHYLRGGPRIIDSTTYYLQARTFALGQFTFQVPDPIYSFNGRFLLQTSGGRLAVLFPPGYAVALALGFWLGAPLAVGPVLAGLLVPSTYWMARELGASCRAGLGAGALSVGCASLHYHTADTMSHGWAALLTTLAVASAARASLPMLGLSGLAIGWLVATRPVTGLVVLVGAFCLAKPAGIKRLCLLFAMVPGLLLLIFQQRAATNQWFVSSQLAYYSVADGPPGCFRYGFGPGIGCMFEHGDFVRAELAHGYGLKEAAANTVRRLAVHTLDIANLAPLALLVPYGAWIARSEAKVRAAFGIVVGVICAYTPFYFEASYPGAGARLFADVLPIEQVIMARALASFGGLRWALPLSVLGFALHTHRQHAALRDREGGRPMFEPDVLKKAGVTRGLVLVSTDHGFALGHDPEVRDASTGVVVARRRGDLLDRMLWEKLRHPPTFLYGYDPRASHARALVRPYDPRTQMSSRLEAENLWPPAHVERGWAHPEFSAMPCVSNGRGLRLRDARVVLRIPPFDRPAYIAIGWTGAKPGILEPHPAELAGIPWKFRLRRRQPGSPCWRSEGLEPLPAGRPLSLVVQGSSVFDYIELSDDAWKSVDN